MDGGQRAFKPNGLTQFRQRQVRLAGQKGEHAIAVAGKNLWFAAGKMVAGADVARVAALLQQLFDHSQRNAETGGDFIAGPLLSVVGVENALTQVN